MDKQIYNDIMNENDFDIRKEKWLKNRPASIEIEICEKFVKKVSELIETNLYTPSDIELFVDGYIACAANEEFESIWMEVIYVVFRDFFFI